MKHTITKRFLPLAVALCLLILPFTGCKSDGDSFYGEMAGDRPDYAPMEPSYSEVDGAYDTDDPMAPGESSDPAEEGMTDSGKETLDDNQYHGGKLTGSEWRDNLHWPYFLEKLNAQNNGWYEIADRWGLIANYRLAVTLKNGDAPVKNARVTLKDQNGQVLWNAVSDKDGYAYLFWNLSGKENVTPATIVVTAPDGTTTTADFPSDSDAVTIQMAAANPDLTLDLMFVIDTTGSMGDELEYLKAELKDVVTQVKQQARVSVRTSVNFYRDIGDEYVVRPFAFTDRLEESVAQIQAQNANGGGDYPEAVHTALNDAINGHQWSNSSVKLLFLVLDAPPHENDEVRDSLIASITKAAEQGIRIIPVVCSGAGYECQVPFRTYAALTGGTYVFLTDDSGVGGSHTLPDVEEIKVELLNQMLVRIICEYCE